MNFTKIYRNITDNIYNHHSILYENISKQSSIPEIIDEIHTIGNYILCLRKYRFIWKYSMTPT